MTKFSDIVIGAVLFMFLVLVVGGIVAIPIYFLWNWLMPEIFGFKEVTFCQALGLTVLSGLLFKSSISSSKSCKCG